jgi:hypothetical protein
MHNVKLSSPDEAIIGGEAAYFYRRAEAELVQAQRATHPKVAAAHHQLAEAYLDRVLELASEGIGAIDPTP